MLYNPYARSINSTSTDGTGGRQGRTTLPVPSCDKDPMSTGQVWTTTDRMDLSMEKDLLGFSHLFGMFGL